MKTVKKPNRKAKRKTSGRGSYPWDVCMEEQLQRYGDQGTAARVCGSIRAKSLRGNPEELSAAEEALVTAWSAQHPKVKREKIASLVVAARGWGVDVSDTARRALEEMSHAIGWNEARRGATKLPSPGRALTQLGKDLNVDVLKRIKEGYEDGGNLLQKNPIRVRDYSTFCEAVASEYDKLPLVEEDQIWRWEKLGEHIRRFYDRVTSQVEVIFVDGQPYDSAEEMRDEVNRTGVLMISRDYNQHPVFDPETNLQFRTVHDYVVHIAPGEGGPDFSRRGEVRAYNLHRRLAPPDTWPALFSEVLAQACYFNARGDFPEQKVAVLRGFDFYNVGLDADGNAIGERKKAPKKVSKSNNKKKATGVRSLVAKALR